MKTYFFDVDATNQKLLANKQLFPGTIQDTDSQLFQDAEIISVFVHSIITKEILEKLPNLKMIALRSTGFDHVDLEYCREKNIVVCNVPSYGEQTVAEFVFALLLFVTRRLQNVGYTANAVDYFGLDLFGKTLGIIGTGNIGMHVAKMAKGFNMKVLGYDLFPNEKMASELGFEYTTMEKLLAQSDIVTLHAPYNETTHHMIGEKEFGMMKNGVIFMNTARGALVENNALLSALESGKIQTALLDVVENDLEEIISHKNVIYTPHVAYNTKEAGQRIVETTLDNISAFENGVLKNQIK